MSKQSGLWTTVPAGTAEYSIRVTRLTVVPPHDQLGSERAMDVEIQSEHEREIVVLTQKSGHIDVKEQQISISKSEWAAMKDAIELMVSECREE
jgi:hypothetical protein